MLSLAPYMEGGFPKCGVPFNSEDGRISGSTLRPRVTHSLSSYEASKTRSQQVRH